MYRNSDQRVFEVSQEQSPTEISFLRKRLHEDVRAQDAKFKDFFPQIASYPKSYRTATHFPSKTHTMQTSINCLFVLM